MKYIMSALAIICLQFATGAVIAQDATTDTINNIAASTVVSISSGNADKPGIEFKNDKIFGSVIGLVLLSIGAWDCYEGTVPSVICGAPFVLAGGFTLWLTWKF